MSCHTQLHKGIDYDEGVHGVVQPIGIDQVQKHRIYHFPIDGEECPKGETHRKGQRYGKCGEDVVSQLPQRSQSEEVKGQRQCIVPQLQKAAQKRHVLKLATNRWLQTQGHRHLWQLGIPTVKVNGIAQVNGGRQVEKQASPARQIKSLHFRIDTNAFVDGAMLMWCKSIRHREIAYDRNGFARIVMQNKL